MCSDKKAYEFQILRFTLYNSRSCECVCSKSLPKSAIIDEKTKLQDTFLALKIKQ